MARPRRTMLTRRSIWGPAFFRIGETGWGLYTEYIDHACPEDLHGSRDPAGLSGDWRCGCGRARCRGLHNEHRAVGVADDFVRQAAAEEPPQPTVPVRPDHD